jgi:hypothetical protein
MPTTLLLAPTRIFRSSFGSDSEVHEDKRRKPQIALRKLFSHKKRKVLKSTQATFEIFYVVSQ